MIPFFHHFHLLVFSVTLIFDHIQKHSANNLRMSRTYFKKKSVKFEKYLALHFIFPLYSLSLSYLLIANYLKYINNRFDVILQNFLFICDKLVKG